MQNDKFIDIEQLFRSKNPAILKWLPKFILNYLKRVIHQEEINDFMFRNKLLKDYEFSKQVIKEFNIKVEIEGIENVPRSGGVILVGNHPLGGMDGIALVTALDGIRNDVTFIVNDLLMNITNLNGIFVGVNKHGRNVGEQLQVVEKLFASDKAVFLFPAGLVAVFAGGLAPHRTRSGDPHRGRTLARAYPPGGDARGCGFGGERAPFRPQFSAHAPAARDHCPAVSRNQPSAGLFGA
jgi:hypothetical protein